MNYTLPNGALHQGVVAIAEDSDLSTALMQYMQTSEQIVAMAPEVPDWEIHPARPACAVPRLALASGDGRQIVADPRCWRYTLHGRPDGAFNIVIEQPGLEGVSEDHRYAAAFCWLDALLGEARSLRLIRNIEVVTALSDDQSRHAPAAEQLPADLAARTAAPV